MERATLEKYDYIINDITAYLSTSVSLKDRLRVSIDELSKIRVWFQDESKDFFRPGEITDGIDLSELKQRSILYKNSRQNRSQIDQSMNRDPREENLLHHNPQFGLGLKTQLLRENLLANSDIFQKHRDVALEAKSEKIENKSPQFHGISSLVLRADQSTTRKFIAEDFQISGTPFLRTDFDLSEVPGLEEVIKLESDSIACYQILNLFSILNEQKTYFIRHNLNEFFAESYINMVDNTRQAHFNSKSRAAKFIIDSRQADYFPKIKGINLLKHGTRKLEYFKEHSFPVIDKILGFIQKLLAYCRIENPVFFELLND